MRRFHGRLTALIALGVLGVLGPSATNAAEQRRSGFDDMHPTTQALQKDDTQNPAMLWVKDGEAEWNKAAGTDKKSCAQCHGDARTSMRGVATRYPIFDAQKNRPQNLAQRINQCRVQQQQLPALERESNSLLGLESWVAMQSRGQPLKPSTAPELSSWATRGEKLFTQRIGQVDLSCAQCHDDNAGKKLAGNVIPQGHPTGYPIYRLAWQEVGSLQRRLRNCMVGVRAEPYTAASDEFAALEVYLARRAAGMAIESPAVRP